MNRAPEARSRILDQALRGAAYWILPPLVCLVLYWRGLRAWFRADDFAWLSSGLDIQNFRDLLQVLFGPAAQGTIRPWSEPGFFLIGYKLFGLHALPFHAVVFATQFANLALVASIGARLTGLRAAGFWAALFWVINGSLVEPLGWVCTFNQVLCGFFLLLAFHFLLRLIETGERRFEVYQWVAFLLGFGALEINLVYPAIAAGYTFLCARKYFRRTLPLAAVSVVYLILHLMVAPVQKTGTYAMHFTGAILQTLGTYWTWSVGPTYTYSPFRLPPWLLPVGIGLVTLGLVWFFAAKIRQRRGAAIFCALWYLVMIAPVLALSDHMTEYYVFLPLIGVCWLGGWAFAEAGQSSGRARAVATALAGLYAFMAVPEAVAGAKWNYELTIRARSLMAGVARAHELYPKKAILLDGVDTDLFRNTVRYQPFRLAGGTDVYLAAGTSESAAGLSEGAAFELSADVAAQALARGDLVVYDARGTRLRNVTSVYAAIPRETKRPVLLDAAVPLNAYLLGPEWYPVDEDHRWMPRHASFRMAGPEHPGEKLYLRGGTAGELLRNEPVTVSVTVDGVPLPAAALKPGQEEFELSFPLPAVVTNKAEMQVMIEASKTFQAPGDPRKLSLHFGTFEVR
jgi:hypothetical protein